MKRRIMRYRKQSRIKEILSSHLQNNFKLYAVSGIIFIIGIILGVLFINNISTSQLDELKNYINNGIANANLTETNYLKELIIENVSIIVILWFAGITVIGIIINYAILIYKGFCIGYTISAITLTLGTGKGIIFVFASMLLQDLLFIPAIIATTVSGMKFFKAILKYKRKEDVILEAIRHTLFSLFMLAIILISAIVEIYISNKILKLSINFFIQ